MRRERNRNMKQPGAPEWVVKRLGKVTVCFSVCRRARVVLARRVNARIARRAVARGTRRQLDRVGRVGCKRARVGRVKRCAVQVLDR